MGSLPLHAFLLISAACASLALGSAGCRGESDPRESTSPPITEADAGDTNTPTTAKIRVEAPPEAQENTPEKTPDERRQSARQRAVDRAKKRAREQKKTENSEATPANSSATGGPKVNTPAPTTGAAARVAPVAGPAASSAVSNPSLERGDAVTRASNLAKRTVPMPNGSAKKPRAAGVVLPPNAPVRKLPSLSGSKSPPTPRATAPPLPISHALNAVELKTLTGKRFQPDELPGQPATSRHNTVYFKPLKSNEYGVSVQLWHEPALRDTRARYENMKSTYPNVTETGNVTNSSFFAHWGAIHHLVFMDLKKRRVISVSAGNQTLTPEQLYAVATKVRDRLLR